MTTWLEATLKDAQLRQDLAAVSLLVLDVDGVLSDGSVYYTANGDEIKAFSILDGLGIKLLQRSGIEVAIITGRNSPLTARRAADLGITQIAQGREDKKVALRELCNKLDLEFSDCAYIGDDLPDLSAITAARVGITVENGHWFVKKHARLTLPERGGSGAVRAACDLILAAKDQLDNVLDSYLN